MYVGSSEEVYIFFPFPIMLHIISGQSQTLLIWIECIAKYTNQKDVIRIIIKYTFILYSTFDIVFPTGLSPFPLIS
jgi:hypothetical protein